MWDQVPGSDWHVKRFAFAAVCYAVAAVGFASVLGFQWGGGTFVTAFDDIGEGVAAMLAIAACLWTAGRSDGRTKTRVAADGGVCRRVGARRSRARRNEVAVLFRLSGR